MQQGLLAGSQTAAAVNLQVAESQQVELTPWPGSQSSPDSTIPLPHIWRERVRMLASGGWIHVAFVWDFISEPGK